MRTPWKLCVECRSGAGAWFFLVGIASLVAAGSVSGVPAPRHVTGAQVPSGATATPGCVLPRSIQIAVIGDYGSCTIRPELCASEAAVAHYVLQAASDFIVTVGDDNYIHGDAGPSRHPPPGGSQPAHIANNNSRAFRLIDFPPPYETLPPPSPPGTAAEEAFPPEPPENPTPGVELYETYIESGRFFIALGNHDWHQVGAGPAKAYFGQQGMDENHPAGLVEEFAVDTNEVSVKGDPAQDPDIENPPPLATQAAGVASKINQSAACWKILYMHHPAYTRSPKPEGHWKPPADVRDFIATVKGLTANDVDAVLSGHLHTLQFVEVPGDKTLYVTNGKGGDFLHNLDRNPVPPGREVWAQPEEKIWGFVMIDVTAGDLGQPSISRYTWHGVAPAPTPTPGGPPTPPVGQWSELWNHWTVDVRSATKTAQECEGGQNLTCNPGNCYSEGWSEVAGQGTCIGTPEPSRCGFEQVEVEADTPERFRCDEEDQTIGAFIKAPVCCPPQLSCPYDRPIGLCHMVADAYDCRGNLLGSYCMDHYGWTGDYPGQYEADTGCVFDRWTVPCRWVIRRTGSVYDLKCGLTRPQVRYYCCEGPECARVYGRS